MRIDAKGVHYRDLNARIRAAAAAGDRDITVEHVEGQRYIGAGLGPGIRITVHGVPGNDLAAFMNGAEITIRGNVQDGVANTMNAGKIVVDGDAGDIVGHSMRGGKVLVRGRVGWRTGIHMKAYGERFPVVVIGGTAGDYLGEYMAGGVLVVLGIGADGRSPVGEYVGTGMHGGTIFIRGRVEPYQVGLEVGLDAPGEDDWSFLSRLLDEFRAELALGTRPLGPQQGLRVPEGQDFGREEFVKLTPKSSRPYGMLYAY